MSRNPIGRGNKHPSIRCPHCDSQSIVRTCRGVTKTYRELYFACSDVECGHTWVAELTIVRTLSPAACPDPSVNLPVTPPQRRFRGAPIRTPANDPMPLLPAAANDQHGMTAANDGLGLPVAANQ